MVKVYFGKTDEFPPQMKMTYFVLKCLAKQPKHVFKSCLNLTNHFPTRQTNILCFVLFKIIIYES